MILLTYFYHEQNVNMTQFEHHQRVAECLVSHVLKGHWTDVYAIRSVGIGNGCILISSKSATGMQVLRIYPDSRIFFFFLVKKSMNKRIGKYSFSGFFVSIS